VHELAVVEFLALEPPRAFGLTAAVLATVVGYRTVRIEVLPSVFVTFVEHRRREVEEGLLGSLCLDGDRRFLFLFCVGVASLLLGDVNGGNRSLRTKAATVVRARWSEACCDGNKKIRT